MLQHFYPDLLSQSQKNLNFALLRKDCIRMLYSTYEE